MITVSDRITPLAYATFIHVYPVTACAPRNEAVLFITDAPCKNFWSNVPCTFRRTLVLVDGRTRCERYTVVLLLPRRHPSKLQTDMR